MVGLKALLALRMAGRTHARIGACRMRDTGTTDTNVDSAELNSGVGMSPVQSTKRCLTAAGSRRWCFASVTAGGRRF